MQITNVTWAVALVILAGVSMPPTRAQEVARPREPGIDVSSLVLPGSAVHRTDIDSAIRSRDWERAERLLAEEIDRQPRSFELLALIARVFFMDGKPLNSAVALKKAEAIRPLDDDLRFTLALAYVRLDRPDWARPELERLVRADPGNAAYRYWIGRLDYDAGSYATAIARFNEALVRDPRSARTHDNLGLCHEMLDRPDEALVHYREAVRLNREATAKSPWPPLNMGILLRQRGEPAEAEKLFAEALRYDERFARAHYQRGTLLEQAGRLDEAVSALSRATALEPTLAEAYYALARIYRRRGETARADAALGTFLRLRDGREPGRE
jgi:tetratricopeptide (TPR) repeat protein